MKTQFNALILAGVVAVSAGCQTYDPYTGEKKTANATTGAVIGALAGAAVGAATSSKKDRGKGALIGAAAGGAVGGGIGYYMDKQESELRHKLEGTGVRVVRNGDQISLVMPGNITFDTGKSSIKAGFFSVLESVGLVLKEFDQTAIQVEGHTDSTGSRETNMRLSNERAYSVKAFLETQGVKPVRIYATGLGPDYPIADNETKEGRERNRRVELKLVPLEQQ